MIFNTDYHVDFLRNTMKFCKTTLDYWSICYIECNASVNGKTGSTTVKLLIGCLNHKFHFHLTNMTTTAPDFLVTVKSVPTTIKDSLNINNAHVLRNIII